MCLLAFLLILFFLCSVDPEVWEDASEDEVLEDIEPPKIKHLSIEMSDDERRISSLVRWILNILEQCILSRIK